MHDKAEIEVKAGRGGDGRISFRHDRLKTHGGPDGGNGGRGGDIIFAADHNLNTLTNYRTARIFKAESGQPGGSNDKKGKSADDTTLHVPVGTTIYEVTPEGRTQMADLDDDGQTAVIAKGGRGGFGNAHFTSSFRQAPKMAELGEPGVERRLVLELKLVADVGIIGLPNAGKSTLLAAISNARPEIADYPFTTLVPNLGVADFDDASLVVADIPGLIEGASAGRGLGHEFLRHIERTSVLVHLIDASSTDPARDYQIIRHELKNYAIDLSVKPELVVVSKIDTVDPKTAEATAKALRKLKLKPLLISAQAHQGSIDLLRAALKLVMVERAKPKPISLPEITLDQDPSHWWLEEVKGGYIVHGQKLERFAVQTDWTNSAATHRMRDILTKTGVIRELERRQAPTNATLEIGGHRIEW